MIGSSISEFPVAGGPSSDNVVIPPIDPPPVDPPPSGGSSDNTITYTLINVEGFPAINLAGLDWSLFKDLRASLFKAPVAQGSLASTSNLGVLAIQVPSGTVPVGQYFLVLTDVTGDTTLACKVMVV